jgi:hypothetical protein
MPQSHDLVVKRADLADARLIDTDLPDPRDGQALLRVDGFALTSNVVTYGVAGDQLGYWEFFPTADPADGRVPVWGFADVVASAHPDLPVGQRIYGYLPMSTHLMVQPDSFTARGFSDAAPHRAARAPIYNHYALCAADPLWSPEAEPLIALFRPLFTTSFLLDDLHRRNDWFGAQSVILSSASSKTAIGLARMMTVRDGGARVIGLTSPANRAFTESLDCYDQVVTYDALDALPDGTAAFVDMAGNADLRRQIHQAYGDRLTSSRAVGMTHWQASGGLGGDLPGPRPEFFFAPAYAQERLADWGAEGFQTRLGAAWQSFAAWAAGWLTVRQVHGVAPTLAVWRDMQAGRIDPSEGLMVSLSD